ncbi:MAG TPA: ATP-binding protein [Candidatus Acidoferrales bacterium]|nr:ATP-binding protein [Candidatus Acidoferrales bacterium]
MHSQRIEVTLDTVLESVDLAEEIALRVAGESGFDEDDCHKIGMSVREGIINAYSYGNRQEHGRKIGMIIEIEERRLVVHIRDEGENFSLADVPDPLAEENLLRTSGRGIFLMRAFMDEFDIQRGPHGGTELVMSKWLPSSAGSGGLTANPSASH